MLRTIPFVMFVAMLFGFSPTPATAAESGMTRSYVAAELIPVHRRYKRRYRRRYYRPYGYYGGTGYGFYGGYGYRRGPVIGYRRGYSRGWRRGRRYRR